MAIHVDGYWLVGELLAQDLLILLHRSYATSNRLIVRPVSSSLIVRPVSSSFTVNQIQMYDILCDKRTV